MLPEETVLLGSGGRKMSGGLWLLREHGSQSTQFAFEPGTTIVGRSSTLCRIVDSAEGVSRTHLEIESDGTNVRIRDLASRNGTLLGNEIMVPYKEYPLQDGDSFRLAGPDGPKYTLRIGG